MVTRTVGVVMNGVSGRMGYRQHLVRSILALRDEGGVRVGGDLIVPDPILLGRNADRLRPIAARHGLTRVFDDIDQALSEADAEVYFDAQVTSARKAALTTAIAAGKHIYTEKPTAETAAEADELAERAAAAGVKNGVVMDKLFLPGLRKLRRLVDSGFFGQILSVRGEFGYWVFEGDWQEAQRPSWNYRSEDGGGITLDMYPHWSYVLEFLFGRVRSVYAHATTHIPQRTDENGERYQATADDASYGIFQLEGGAVAQINSSWAVRVNRDELVEFAVDGTEGSAVAGLFSCRTQHRVNTPKPVWNPDLPTTEDFRRQWDVVPDNAEMENGFKTQWVEFLKHAYGNGPFPYDLTEAARGVRLAELALESARKGTRIEVPGPCGTEGRS
jgi:predicted dehydrogenase